MTRAEIIELMARALCFEDGMHPDADIEGGDAWYCYEDGASAALTALESAGLCIIPKEPSEETIVAGDEKIIEVLNDATFALKNPTIAHQCYCAMVAQAVKEQNE